MYLPITTAKNTRRGVNGTDIKAKFSFDTPSSTNLRFVIPSTTANAILKDETIIKKILQLKFFFKLSKNTPHSPQPSIV